ncbi:MAG TPA: hypothetical protein VFA56_03220 [Gaiellaceae bacterium]|nr:hypothetical protein [Gaiellaceae bacterium]
MIEIVVWLAVVAISLTFLPLGLIPAIWSLHRVAGAIALARAHQITARGSRVHVLAGWLYITRTFMLGLLLSAIGVEELVAHPVRAGLLLGALLIFVSSPFLILGVQLIHRWRAEVG